MQEALGSIPSIILPHTKRKEEQEEGERVEWEIINFYKNIYLDLKGNFIESIDNLKSIPSVLATFLSSL
jgi:hypothetical protein